MPVAKPKYEVEIKLRVDDAAAGRRLLRKAGFRAARPRALEHNVLFDTGAQALRKRGLLVRLRSYGGEHVVTFKGPAELAAGRRAGSLHRKRLEHESLVSDAQAITEIWAALGLEPSFRYEKYRTYFRRVADGDGVATLDETPMGCFLELEGKGFWIDRVARLLGYTPRDYIRDSYIALYSQECQKQGKKFRDMLFDVRRKSSTRESL
jgi:adenylate cyclase class 2